MRISATLAWRYLIGRPGRTVLTTLAIVFGVALIFGLNGMMPGLIGVFERTLFASAGQVDLSVTSQSGGTFDRSVADQVAHVAGVAAATPSLRRSVGMPSESPVSIITLVGIDAQTATKVREFNVAAGRMIGAGDAGEVVIGTDTAEKLGLGVGSQWSIPTVAGLQRYVIVGLLSNGSSPSSPEAYVPLSDAQRVLGAGDKISSVESKFETNADRARVEAAVSRKLGSDFNVGGVSGDTTLLASLQVANFAFSMFGFFALIMGGFIILNTFRTLVAERRHDIGMLRAIGADRRTILGIFMVQSLIQGALGTAAGIAVGYLITLAALAAYVPLMKDILRISEKISPSYSIGTWALAIGMGMGVTVLGAVIPARQAARITPLEALRPQVAEVAERQRSRWILAGWAMLGLCVPLLLLRQTATVGLGAAFALIGLVMVAPALIEPLSRSLSFLLRALSPSTAELASSNVTRQPGRAAATASAILVSLAVVIAMLGLITSLYAGFFDYLDKSLGSDFVLIPQGLLLGGGNVGADEALVQRIADSPGVGDVATLRLGMARQAGGQVQVVGIDPVTYPKVASFTFSEGTNESDLGKLAKGRTVLVNGIYAAQHGVTVGERLAFETPSGVKNYAVAGIATDYLNAKLATVYISQDNLAEDFNVTTNVLVLANAKEGVGLPAVKATLARLLAAYPQFVLYDTQSFKASQSAIFANTLGVFYVLMGFFALPTLLALLNTLAISVLSRTREIGMLRAVGTTRQQVRGMVVAEALLLAAVGVLFGILGGLALGYALVYAMNATGFVMPYYFPWAGIVVAAVAGFSFALLAAIIPARSAARLDIVAALHYE